jgi:two-component system chemotaxis sensor kinase CheA
MAEVDPNERSEFVDQFLDDFYAECDEHLTLIRRALLVLEDALDHGPLDRSLFDELFRSFHTLKGISGMVSLEEAEKLAHSLESYLRVLRDGKSSLNSEGLSSLVAGVSTLENIINARRHDQKIPGILNVVARLDTISTASVNQDATESGTLQAQTSSTPRWRVEFTPTPQLAERGVNLNAIRARLKEFGELVSAKPIVKNAGEIAFEFVLEGLVDDDQRAGFSTDGAEFTSLAAEFSVDAEKSEEPQPVARIAPTSIVRVDLARLDELMQMVGELVISRTRLQEQIVELRRQVPASTWRPLHETTLLFERQLKELRTSVMRVRMVPIGKIFERMQFVVRDLARESEKKIFIRIEGGDTEIDKFLVERMMEPLLHLVRNAVGHGLEPVREREAKGKKGVATLSLSARTVGESVVIRISDDGRGIDRQRVLTRAHETGLIHKEAELDDALLLDLICAPGLSTRDKADRESGRGVGMDVVRTVVEELGGHLSLSTQSGEGTTFTIALPLTLAIADALIVSVDNQKFAVPQAAVREVLEVEPGEAKLLENNEIISYRGGVLPVVRLARLFDLHCERDKSFHVFVVGDDANQLGVGVDRILGQREIVVRGISDPLAQTQGIAGATELGDKRVVLILDVAALREYAANARH